MSFVWHHTKRISTVAGKHTVRFLFPPLWHYMTDDYKGRLHHLVVDSILGLTMMSLLAINVALIAWLYLFFIPPEFDVSLEIVADPIVSGADLPVDVQYTVGNKNISDVSIRLHGPQGWQISKEESYMTWDALSGSSQETIHTVAPFTTHVNQTNRILAMYEYRYFGQQYYGLAEVTFVAKTSSLEIVPHIPTKVLNTESAVMQFEYSNSSDYTRGRTCIEFTLPEHFTVTSSSHELIDQQVCFDQLDPREHGVIEIVGTFQNAIGEGQLVIDLRVIDYLGIQAYTQVSVSTPIHVLTPRLVIATTGSPILNVGDTARYSVIMTNTGDATLTNVLATVNLSGFENRISAVTPIDGVRVGDQLQWNIAELPAGQSMTKTFITQTNPAWREKNISLHYNATATADIEDIGVSTYALRVEKDIKFNSTLQFDVVGRYTATTGEQLGYGPYPMEADSITALRVIWEIKDFTNDLNNVTIQTTLPSQVEWTGVTSVTEGSRITYDPATRTVTWHTASVPSFSHGQGAQFEVRVSPNSQQIGKRINVTNNTIFTARDSHTAVVIARDHGALRTDQPINPSQ